MLRIITLFSALALFGCITTYTESKIYQLSDNINGLEVMTSICHDLVSIGFTETPTDPNSSNLDPCFIGTIQSISLAYSTKKSKGIALVLVYKENSHSLTFDLIELDVKEASKESLIALDKIKSVFRKNNVYLQSIEN